jgi:hypothetical protein
MGLAGFVNDHVEPPFWRVVLAPRRGSAHREMDERDVRESKERRRPDHQPAAGAQAHHPGCRHGERPEVPKPPPRLDERPHNVSPVSCGRRKILAS